MSNVRELEVDHYLVLATVGDFLVSLVARISTTAPRLADTIYVLCRPKCVLEVCQRRR